MFYLGSALQWGLCRLQKRKKVESVLIILADNFSNLIC